MWLTYEIAVSPAFVQKAKVIKSSADSTHSHASKLTLIGGGISGTLSNALYSLGLPGLPQDSIEDLEEKYSPGLAEESPKMEEPPSPVNLKARLQGKVRDVSVLGNVASAFLTAGQQHRHGRHTKSSSSTRNLSLDTSFSPVPMTKLNLPTEAASSIILDSRFGIIRHIAYSEDGKWFGVTWLVQIVQITPLRK
jgi:hypothetical protein